MLLEEERVLGKENKDVLVKDHPTKAGCEIYE